MKISLRKLFGLSIVAAVVAFAAVPVPRASALDFAGPESQLLAPGDEEKTGDHTKCRSWSALGKFCADLSAFVYNGNRYVRASAHVYKPSSRMPLNDLKLSLEVCVNSTSEEKCSQLVGSRQYATLTSAYKNPDCGLVLLGMGYTTIEGCYSERDEIRITDPYAYVGKWMITRGKAYVNGSLYQTVYSEPYKFTL